MTGFKKLLVLGLAAISALGVSGCTESDIAFGAGVIVGVIIDDGGHHHRRPNPPRYRKYRRYSEINLSQLAPAQRVAIKYDLSLDQAQKLTSELLKVQAGDLSGFKHLGFDKSDLVLMAQGHNPSASTLANLAQALDLDIAQAHELIQNIKVDVAEAQERML
ncbi:MAG: hypothetical protein ACK5V3_14995 [Bdellovibrionales bacterium]